MELKETPEFKNGGFDQTFPVMILYDSGKVESSNEFAKSQGWPGAMERQGIWGRSTLDIKEHESPNLYMFVIDLRKGIQDEASLKDYIQL